MLTVVGLLVYAVIQRQVRLYLHAHDQHVPGNKGPTATPTTAVVCALFTSVMLVQFVRDDASSFQLHGIQDHHLLVCEAVGIDPAWYRRRGNGAKFAAAYHTPLNVGSMSHSPQIYWHLPPAPLHTRALVCPQDLRRRNLY